MQIRIVYCLITGACMLAGCKKETKHHYSGIILHKATNQPVADVEVFLQFMNDPFTNPQHAYYLYSTHTNAEGKYELTVDEVGNAGRYFINCKKQGLVTVSLKSLKGNPLLQKYDTAYVEDASYLRVIVETTSKIGSDFATLDCRLLGTDVEATVRFSDFTASLSYYANKKDTQLVTFSTSMYQKAHASLVRQFGFPTISIEVLTEQEVTLQPFTTTDLHLKY